MVAASTLRRNGILPNLADAFEGARSDWNAARPSQYRRRRSGLSAMGSGADYHYRNESDYLKIVETARDFIRNDCIVSKGLDRVADQVQPDCFQVEPKTGDLALDAETRRALVLGVEWVSLELAARFAADALLESYFGWDARRFPGRGEHNLVRAQGQLSLHTALVAARPARERMIESALA